MLLNYYLKLKSQLTSATSATNNYFRTASGVLALNVVAEGSGRACTGHLEPSIWSKMRSFNLFSGSSPCLPWGSLFIPSGLQQWLGGVAVVAVQLLEVRTLGYTCRMWPEFQCFQQEKGEGSNPPVPSGWIWHLQRTRLSLPSSITIFPFFFFFFKSGWTPSWEK